MRVYKLAGLLFFFCSFVQTKITIAQEHEIGIWGGISHSFGDINTTLNSFQFYQKAGGIYYKYNFNPRIGLNSGFSIGSTEGYDQASEKPYQIARNLDFRTSIAEISSRIDFNFFSFDRTKPKEWYTPYVFIGLNGYYFNPQGTRLGNWIDLQPLGTEGQNISAVSGNKLYHRIQLGVPVGGGIKFALNENWAIGIEGNWHFLFTDYLDDVSTVYTDANLLLLADDGEITAEMADKSTLNLDVPQLGIAAKQRGNSQNNDAYFFAGITISYTIVNLKCPPPSAKGFKKK